MKQWTRYTYEPTGDAEYHTLSRWNSLFRTFDQLLGSHNSADISPIDLEKSALESLGEVRVIVLKLTTSSRSPQEARQCEQLLLDNLLLLELCLSLDCSPQCLQR